MTCPILSVKTRKESQYSCSDSHQSFSSECNGEEKNECQVMIHSESGEAEKKNFKKKKPMLSKINNVLFKKITFL